MKQRISTRTVVIGGLAVALLLAAVVSYYASGSPDGLERVAENLGFAGTAGEHAAGDSPLADYGVGGIGDARLSGGLAGVIGVLVVGIVMVGLTRLLRRSNSDSTED
ncbi:PDGLE domain-containing protein [Janibacter alittae]|uniref:PDGLE domain-containing protein n=1 Tax=Janibacter alittae TaxID=3115209 RepID=A0ABZ2MEJ0_9MICO